MGLCRKIEGDYLSKTGSDVLGTRKCEVRGGFSGDKTVLEVNSDHVVVNDKLIISKGKLLHNDYVVRLENNEAVYWIIENKSFVKSQIASKFYKYRVREGNVSDCFDLLINEFNFRGDYKYNKNYFGSDSEYNIKHYIMTRIKYVVLKYRNSLHDKKDVTPFITPDESDYYMGQVEEIFESPMRLGVPEDYVSTDNKYWDDLFEGLKVVFKEYVEDRLYKEFDYEKFLIEMYICVDEYKDLSEHYDKVSKECGESRELVEVLVKDMVKDVEREESDSVYILKTIQELIEGRKKGWTPRRIREGEKNASK